MERLEPEPCSKVLEFGNLVKNPRNIFRDDYVEKGLKGISRENLPNFPQRGWGFWLKSA